MAVQLICASHSPLMTTGIEESEHGVQAEFFRELDSCAAALHKFKPDLVVVFGPDHFNGFFYELMPAFCIGTAAEATKDWHFAVCCGCRASWRSPACVICNRATSTSRCRMP
jgi:2,3-dihydroxyphenylpropionate 1,2-dioxygenase